MRLGLFSCALKENSLARSIYKTAQIKERHRHRYELNNDYLSSMERAGLIASGVNTESGLVEMVELQNHPWFIGCQFHPEYQSTVLHPHPLFISFVKHAKEIHSPSTINTSIK